MATAKFDVPAASLDEALFGAIDVAEVLSYSSSEIRLGVPGGATLLVLVGRFNFTPNGELTGGTLTGLTAYQADGVGKGAVLSGMNVDLLTLLEVSLTGTEDELGNLLFGGADRFTGSPGADLLPSYNGNDTIDGGAGIDTMEGGNGSDTYVVRDVGDVVTETNSSSAGGGTDTVQIYLGNYTLPTYLENGRIMISGAAKLVGNSLANALTGGIGADTLVGGAGNDTLAGGNGDDTADYTSAPSAVKVNLSLTGAQATGGAGTDTLSSIERLTGSSHADQITGNSGANRLTGGEGNDTLDGGAGNDTLSGGNGADTYRLRDAGDSASETNAASSGGVDTVLSYLPGHSLGANIENGRIMSSGTASLTGNGLNNLLVGGAGNNTLSGGAGNDSLEGGAGNDNLDGGTGSDRLVGGTGNDSYTVDSSGDVVSETSTVGTEIDSVSSSVTFMLGSNLEKLMLTGTSGLGGTGNALANTITGNTGSNLLSGRGGNDTLNGGDGNDNLDGGTGNDSLVGGAGNDSYAVDSSSDLISETSTLATEIDRVTSSASFTLGSNLETLTLTGTAALNGTGNALTNAIIGNTGNNLLSGLGGNDVLTGGEGIDIFRFASAVSSTTNLDVVTDFVKGEDRIQLENSVFTKFTTTGVLSAANFVASSTGVAVDSNDCVLYEIDTGRLFYDADGSGAGASVLIALLSSAPVLSNLEIFVT